MDAHCSTLSFFPRQLFYFFPWVFVAVPIGHGEDWRRLIRAKPIGFIQWGGKGEKRETYVKCERRRGGTRRVNKGCLFLLVLLGSTWQRAHLHFDTIKPHNLKERKPFSSSWRWHFSSLRHQRVPNQQISNVFGSHKDHINEPLFAWDLIYYSCQDLKTLFTVVHMRLSILLNLQR